jgi:hypothetical protein
LWNSSERPSSNRMHVRRTRRKADVSRWRTASTLSSCATRSRWRHQRPCMPVGGPLSVCGTGAGQDAICNPILVVAPPHPARRRAPGPGPLAAGGRSGQPARAPSAEATKAAPADRNRARQGLRVHKSRPWLLHAHPCDKKRSMFEARMQSLNSEFVCEDFGAGRRRGNTKWMQVGRSRNVRIRFETITGRQRLGWPHRGGGERAGRGARKSCSTGFLVEQCRLGCA